MFAVFAVIAFAVAFILHVFTHNNPKIVEDAVILGLLFIAAHLAWALAVPWGRRQV